MNILQFVFHTIIIMNATRILNIFRRTSSSHIKVPLGRWNIHNYKETMLKINYANEDNCGISGMNYKNTTQIQTNAAILAMRESRAEGSRNRRSHADAGRADVAFLSVDALGAIVVLG